MKRSELVALLNELPDVDVFVQDFEYGMIPISINEKPDLCYFKKSVWYRDKEEEERDEKREAAKDHVICLNPFYLNLVNREGENK